MGKDGLQRYRAVGIEGLKPQRKGRRPKVPDKASITPECNINQDEKLKQLEEENSVMENFFGLLKQEIYYGHTYHSFEELERAIRHYITYYNKHRIKAKLGWLSPIDYRLRHAAT